MKKILFTCALATTISLQCMAQKTGTSFSYSNNSENDTHSIVYHDDNGNLEIKYSGEIIFNEAGNAVESISAKGYVKYKQYGKTISIWPGDNGKPVYEINGDKKVTLRQDETEFLTAAIKTMIAHGLGGKTRVQQIYKRSGSGAVLKEVEGMKSDYVKAIYLDYLLETKSLTNAEVIEILDKTDNLISSDFEKGHLLNHSAVKYITNDATRDAYLQAVKNIGSDFEKANAIKNILKEPLNDSQFTAVMLLINDIGSDFEKANVLKEVLSNNKISPERFSEVLKVASNIGSDFQAATVLRNVLKNNKLPEAQFNETLSVINNIGSDFEKANILKQVAEQAPSKESQWLSLLHSTEQISSDFEKGNVLITIASRMPQSDTLKAAFMKTAKTISSDHDYGRVVRAVK